ncbi:MAG: hypothetical protein ABIP54_02375 [Candidatus Andersenbacteria bacterium]
MKHSLLKLLTQAEQVLFLSDRILSPDNAYEIATKIVSREPALLSAVIFWRWEMELKRGVINFDPREPNSYQEAKIGHYIKRIIPDRIQVDTEKFSDPYVPVFLPFEKKYPNNFDFTMSKPGQKLASIFVENVWFDIYASNSPLASVPHTLLVPQELRSHFLLPIDFDVVLALCANYPEIHFIYSSMGAGAGVNHQHWHMMMGDCEYPILNRNPKTMLDRDGIQVSCYTDWPTDCLLIEKKDKYIGMEIEERLIQYLQNENIPYNLFIKNQRTWINPRSHISTKTIPGKKYGAWETILGICNTGSQEQYNFVNEDTLEKALRDIQLDQVEKSKIVKKMLEFCNF